MLLFLFPFDLHIGAIVLVSVCVVHRYRWHRNPTVRRLEHLVQHDRAKFLLSLVLLMLALPALAGAEPPIRAIHIAGYAEMIGSDRKVATCLMSRLQAQGPFTFPDAADAADAVLTLATKIPSGSSRVLWGRPPVVTATLRRGQAVAWDGSNKYRKGTTAWAAGGDLECGLANGLANKIVKAIQQAER
jgi:hypothetical protein